jgi:hypothetical protein
MVRPDDERRAKIEYAISGSPQSGLHVLLAMISVTVPIAGKLAAPPDEKELASMTTPPATHTQ